MLFSRFLISSRYFLPPVFFSDPCTPLVLVGQNAIHEHSPMSIMHNTFTYSDDTRSDREVIDERAVGNPHSKFVDGEIGSVGVE